MVKFHDPEEPTDLAGERKKRRGGGPQAPLSRATIDLVDAMVAANKKLTEIRDIAGVSIGYASKRRKAFEAQEAERGRRQNLPRPKWSLDEISEMPVPDIHDELMHRLSLSAVAEEAVRQGLATVDIAARATLSRSVATLVKAIGDLDVIIARRRDAERDRVSGSEMDDYLEHLAGTGTD